MMKQEEFFSSFREALDGEVSESVIQENENYYRNYIYQQMNLGRTEEDVLGELGNPRLLAKTIIESSKFAAGEETAEKGFYSGNYHREENPNNAQQQSQNHAKTHTMQIPGWLLAIVGILILALIIGLVFSVISFFAPVILVVLGATLVYRLIKWITIRY